MKIALVFPGYNESKRFFEKSFDEIIQNSPYDLFMVNDGSSDDTFEKMSHFSSLHPNRVFVVDYKENQGKASAVYKAFRKITEMKKYDYIGYFDFDFSTPSSEILRLCHATESNHYSFVFGSRIKMLNAKINRKVYRHFIGRFIITILNLKYALSIYDTQCGAKLFSKEAISIGFDKPFKTSWLFDVEIFIRLKRGGGLKEGVELPLQNWVDVEGSKLKFYSIFKIIKELIILFSI